MITHDNITIRIKLVFFLVGIVLFSLVFRLYHVQITRHPELLAKAKLKYTAVASKTGERGKIYDFNGNLLVGNAPCVTIVADPQIVGDNAKCREVADYFAEKLALPSEVLYKRLSKKTRVVPTKTGGRKLVKNLYAPIEQMVDYELSKQIKKDIETRGFKGITFRDKTKRYYPKNELLANILGFTNIDRDQAIAVVGVEKLFNNRFCPTRAKTRYERGRDGLPLIYGNRTEKEAKDGLNVYLTIQESIQVILEEELDKLMAKWSPKAAYAIMAEPYTGNILAIAQRPTYNPNDRSTMKASAWRNRITEDVFEPGSTMKPIAIAGALDYGVVTPRTRFNCEKGRWIYAKRLLRDSHPMENLTVSEIIQKSSNIGTAKISLLLGEERLYQVLCRFGFGQKTGIALKPETVGIFHPLKRWDSLSITRFPMGQGIAASPLQLVRSYCALANGGNLVKLRLVDRLENPTTGSLVKVPLEPAPRVFFRSSTHKQIIDMMKLVTRQGGTALQAAIPGYDVAGKTGTSQKVVNGTYSHAKFFASFIGFVPVENPAFVLLVTADEPQKNYYGGTVAGPAFKSIAEKTLRLMNVKPTFTVANK